MKKLLFPLFTCLLFCSCKSYYYYPTYQTQITIQKKNEIQAAVFSDILNNGASVNYSITDNVGVGFIHNNFGFAKMTDIYPFFFKNFPQNKKSSLNLSFIPSYCFGKIEETDYNINVNRIYFQPSLMYTSKYFDIGASYRYSIVNYQIQNISINNQANNFDFSKNKSYDFNEASLSIAAGIPFIKLQLAYNTVSRFNDNSFDYIPESLYLGLVLKQNLSDLFKKKE